MNNIIFELCTIITVNYNDEISCTGTGVPVAQGTTPTLLAGMPIGPGVSPQPGFYSRGIWLPVVTTFTSGQTKAT